jgi:hypothetical protein
LQVDGSESGRLQLPGNRDPVLAGPGADAGADFGIAGRDDEVVRDDPEALRPDDRAPPGSNRTPRVRMRMKLVPPIPIACETMPPGGGS